MRKSRLTIRVPTRFVYNPRKRVLIRHLVDGTFLRLLPGVCCILIRGMVTSEARPLVSRFLHMSGSQLLTNERFGRGLCVSYPVLTMTHRFQLDLAVTSPVGALLKKGLELRITPYDVVLGVVKVSFVRGHGMTSGCP